MPKNYSEILSKTGAATHPYDDKSYTQVVAQPGRVAQARELTESQSILRDIIKSVADGIWRDGDTITGCQVSVNAQKSLVDISEGKVYLNGAIRKVDAQQVEITGSGTELIGLVIDYEEYDGSGSDTDPDVKIDTSLLDQISLYGNYHKAGASRIKETVRAIKSTGTDGAVVICKLVNGDRQLMSQAPEYSTIESMLARRTYDESGSYIVRGLTVETKDHTDPSKYYAVVSEGKAYVLGYEVEIPSPRFIEVERSTETAVQTRHFQYVDGTADYRISDQLYVQSLNSTINTTAPGSISATYSATAGAYTLSAAAIKNRYDTLDMEDPHIRVTKVYRSTKTYSEGVDYSIFYSEGTSDPILSWLQSPGDGQYQIEFTYNAILKLDEDYTLTSDGSSQYLHWIKIGTTGHHPFNNADFSIRYNLFKARKDLVYLDDAGNTVVIKGIPDIKGRETAPAVPQSLDGRDFLALAIVSSPPNGSAEARSSALRLSVANTGLKRFTMSDIDKMLKRIRTLEYDSAATSLESEAMQMYTQSQKKGVLVDPFIDWSRADLTYNLDNEGRPLSEVVFNMASDFRNNIVYLPVAEKNTDLKIDLSKSSGIKQPNNRLVSLDVQGETVVLEQPKATRIFNVNPYSQCPGDPLLAVEPAVDVWIDDHYIYIKKDVTESQVVKTSTAQNRNTVTHGGHFSAYTTTSSSTRTTEVGVTTTSVTSESVSDEAIEYARAREITVNGSNFYPNMRSISLKIAGIPVDSTGTDGVNTSTGQSFTASPLGTFTRKFTIPEGKVKCGTSLIQAESPQIITGWGNYAETNYQAAGTKRTHTVTTTDTHTVLLEQITTVTTTTHVDPVGQSFCVPTSQYISAIEVYFARLPQGVTTPIILEVRNVINGLIGEIVHASCVKTPSECFASEDSTVPTRFDLNQPVALEQNKMYAFTLRSQSDEYIIWAAEMGEDDVITKTQVSKNAYLEGTMYSSSNNDAWTIHQSTDLKFRIIGPSYVKGGTDKSFVVFQPVTPGPKGASMLTLLAEQIQPAGTSIKWYYSVGGSYIEISPYSNISLPAKVTSPITIMAVLERGSSDSASPIIALDTCTLILGAFESTGKYILNNVSNLDPYDEVQVIAEVYRPAGTSLKFYCSNSGTTGTQDNWVEMSLDPEYSTAKEDGWIEQRYVYRYGNATNTNCRLRFDAAAEDSVTGLLSPAVRRFRGIMTLHIDAGT